MSWVTKLFAGSAGGFIESIGNVADKFITTDTERQDFKLEMETLLQKRDIALQESLQVELGAKERVLVAELTQGDRFTKSARPSVVYAGLAFIFLNYCLIPVISYIWGQEPLVLELPTEFWVGWSGIVSTWSIGRTFEKRGAKNKAVSVITGTKTTSLL